MGKLSQKMDFDCVVEIAPFGENLGLQNGRCITYRNDLYAPNLTDEELDSSEWEFFSGGYTLQDSYAGPIMHNSIVEGWAIVRYVGGDATD